MENILNLITLGITSVLSLISFFISRELNLKDKEIARLYEKLSSLEERVNKQDVTVEKLNGNISTVIAILERLEKRLEDKFDLHNL